ncbi:hypothetical protein V6N13_110365 [Hibiscus sabdariffa]
MDSEVEAQVIEPKEVREKVGIGNMSSRLHVGNEASGVVEGRSLRTINVIDGGLVSVGKERAEVLNVAAKGKVIAVASELPAGKHKAVMVVDADGGRVTKSTKGRVRPVSIRGEKLRNGSKLQLGVQGGEA